MKNKWYMVGKGGRKKENIFNFSNLRKWNAQKNKKKWDYFLTRINVDINVFLGAHCHSMHSRAESRAEMSL
jgi:hypothetical protein